MVVRPMNLPKNYPDEEGGGIKIHRSIVTKLPIILGKIWNCMRPARNKMFSDVKTSNLIRTSNAVKSI